MAPRRSKQQYVYYYCTAEECEEIEATGKICCEDLDEEDEYGSEDGSISYSKGVYLSNTPPDSEKFYSEYFDEHDCENYIKLPKSWMHRVAHDKKWDLEVLEGPALLFRFLLTTNKHRLDITDADYVIRGETEFPEDEGYIEFNDPDFFYHYTTVKKVAEITSSGYIWAGKGHTQFSGVHARGVCVTDAHEEAASEYIKYQAFRNGGNPKKLNGFIKLPKDSVYTYAQNCGDNILRYRDGRSSFIVPTGNDHLYLDDIEGWTHGYRNI